IRMRGNRPRIHQARVRRNERHEIAVDRRPLSPGQICVDCCRQRRSRTRIPRARDGRATDAHDSALSEPRTQNPEPRTEPRTPNPTMSMLAFAMPQELSRDHVAAIAGLANLQLDPEEIELFARQLADILAYADEVQRADTTGVPPTTSVVTLHRVERQDELAPCLDVADALANAPDAAPDAGLFKVPRVLG